MDRQQAMAVAAAFLRQAFPTAPPTIVMRPDRAAEFGWAWRVLFDTQEHIDSGDFTQAPMVRVVVVPKDGSAPHFPPSAFSVSENENYLNTGRGPARFRGTGR